MKPSVHEAHLHLCMDIVWGTEVQEIAGQAAEAMKEMIRKEDENKGLPQTWNEPSAKPSSKSSTTFKAFANFRT